MDRMREEFEKINPTPSGVIRCGDSYAATDWGWVSQDYVKAFKAFKSGWEVSRRDIVVKLPRCWNDEQRDYRDELVDTLNDLGVKYE